MIDIKQFAQPDWTQIWAGSWSLLTCSQFGRSYTKTLIINGKIFMTRTILFMKDGKSSCVMTQSDRDALGKHLAKEVTENPSRVAEIAEQLKREVDQTMDFMKQHETGEITKELYADFWSRINEYYKPHVNVKYIVDYLNPELLKEYLPILEEARVYAEPVFKHSEDFMQALAAQIGAKTGYSPELVLCLLQDELTSFWETGTLPEQAVLQERRARSALLVDASGALLKVGEEVTEIEKLVNTTPDTKVLKGSTAFPGKVQGVARIVLDPTKADHFEEGNILVTGMTRPEYMQLMQKSAAIVTDAGGILSHAAITARELKKPCVIGTNKATKVLKDGDMIEVDADKGVVTILG